jgi:hypothetical protein
MAAPSIIPQLAENQAMVMDNPNGTIHLVLHRIGSHTSLDLTPNQAMELSDDLRFRARAMMADAPTVGAK